MEFFLVRISLYSTRIQKNMDQKKLRIWTLFTQWKVLILYFLLSSMSDMFLYSDNAKPFANISTQITKLQCWKFHISYFWSQSIWDVLWKESAQKFRKVYWKTFYFIFSQKNNSYILVIFIGDVQNF